MNREEGDDEEEEEEGAEAALNKATKSLVYWTVYVSRAFVCRMKAQRPSSGLLCSGLLCILLLYCV